MGILIDSDDFIGTFDLAQGTYVSADIDASIDLWEKRILTNLLGVELFDLFEREAASETLTEPERLTLSRLLVLADPRHGGPIRQQMAEAADLDISGLTAEQAACRIGAHRCGGE